MGYAKSFHPGDQEISIGKTGNFPTVAARPFRCPSCRALANPRWGECLACGTVLPHGPADSNPSKARPEPKSADAPNAGHAGAKSSADEAAIARWLNEHPPENVSPDLCAACGGFLIEDFVPLFTAHPGRRVWVHLGGLYGERCYRRFQDARRAQAIEALTKGAIG